MMERPLRIGDVVRTPPDWVYANEEWRVVLIGGDLDSDLCLLSDGSLAVIGNIESECVLVEQDPS